MTPDEREQAVLDLFAAVFITIAAAGIALIVIASVAAIISAFVEPVG